MSDITSQAESIFGGANPPDFSTMSDWEIAGYVSTHFPSLLYLLNLPEVGPLIIKAAKEGWDSLQLQSQIEATAWFRDQSATAREFATLQQTDPETANRQIAEKQNELIAMAQSAGLVGVGPDELKLLAIQSLQQGFSDLTVHQHLLLLASEKQGGIPAQLSGGSIATTASQLKSMAAQYLLPISDAAATQYAQQIWSGQLTLESLQGDFVQQATNAYAGTNAAFADALSRGVTPLQYLSPQLQMVATTLQMDPTQINLLDPKWSAILNQPDGQGGTRLMTMPESGLFARQQTEYRYTDQANDEADQKVLALLNTMGAVKTS